MSECKDHIGEYEKSAACLVCLVSYWSQTVVPMRDKRIAELEEQVHTKISEDVKAFLRHDTIKKQTQRIAELEAQLADMKYELISEARLDAIEQYGVDLEFSGIDIHHRIGKKLQAMVKGEES